MLLPRSGADGPADGRLDLRGTGHVCPLDDPGGKHRRFDAGSHLQHSDGAVDFAGFNRRREHFGRAFKTGFIAANLGLLVTISAAVWAPAWTLEAALFAAWLAFVALSLHFGWLQRAADRAE